MWHASKKSLWVTTQYGGAYADAQLVVGIGDGFEQPDAKKSCAAGNENSLSVELVPKISRVIEYVL